MAGFSPPEARHFDEFVALPEVPRRILIEFWLIHGSNIIGVGEVVNSTYQLPCFLCNALVSKLNRIYMCRYRPL